jgi:hypothetical protein
VRYTLSLIRSTYCDITEGKTAMRHFLSCIASSTILLAAGCTQAMDHDLGLGIDTEDQALDGHMGAPVNTVSVNGVSPNGVSPNGTSINGVSPNGISVSGISVNGVSVSGSVLTGMSSDGTVLSGADFVGATLTAYLSDDTTLPLRIDDAAWLTGTNSDVLGYAISMQSGGGWTPACGVESDGTPVLALVVAGTWDPSSGAWRDDGRAFSLSCRHAAVAKCVEFGYKSWLGYNDYHRACVRMLRADYCGDGIPHTVNGTLINLYDNLGIQADAEPWPVDAEWGPDGALCINHIRGGALPACYAAKFSATCGGFSRGGLLADEYNGQ